MRPMPQPGCCAAPCVSYWAHRGILPASSIHRPRGAVVTGAIKKAIRCPAIRQAGSIRQQSIQVVRSEEHTSELQSLMRISYAVFCLKKKKTYCHIYNKP